MAEFLEYVLWQLQNGLVLVLLAGVIAAAIIGVTYVLYRRKYKGSKKFPWGWILLGLLFLGYLVIVLYATILRSSGGYREWNLHLFRAWREAWNNFSTRNWANVLLNIAMFGPLGFLLPLMGKQFRKWYVMIPTGFGLSLAIELAQLALKKGICDVDDLFCNGLGAAMGFFAVMAILSLWGEKGKRLKPMLGYLGLMLVPVLGIGSIFACYQLKEYGNLPDAAAYRVDLRGLNWTVACELPDGDVTAPVYRSRTMSYADCEAFAQKIADLSGQEIDITSYYQEFAYFNLSRGVVQVYYFDGSYRISGFDLPFTPCSGGDRVELEKALEPFELDIPEAAVFSQEEHGWYQFSCDHVIEGDQLLNGELRVRYEQEDQYLRIENHLVRYTHYQDVSILSPMEAYRKLLRGDFEYAAALKYDAEDAVSVISCALDYEIDTKGFYQPVYRFEITIPGTEYICPAMIPAMK